MESSAQWKGLALDGSPIVSSRATWEKTGHLGVDTVSWQMWKLGEQGGSLLRVSGFPSSEQEGKEGTRMEEALQAQREKRTCEMLSKQAED